MVDTLRCIERRIRELIAASEVPEDPAHAENTLAWLLRLDPDADEALRIAALGHDIDRAMNERKVKRADFDDYDAFKAAHARHSAGIVRNIMVECGAEPALIEEVCRLIERHEVGGDERSDLLRDADSLSYYDTNLPLYYQREGYEETLRRARWGYARLSPRARAQLATIRHDDPVLNEIIRRSSRSASG